MPEETLTIEEEEEEEENSPEESEDSGEGVLTPEGLVMLSVAGLLDVAGWVCAILIAAFGIGALIGRIVSICGYIIIGIWQLARSGGVSIPWKAKGGKIGSRDSGIVETMAKKFLKRQWKKLVVEAIPVLGDISPTFTLIVWSELRGK